jgi:hypothetical protein
MATLELYKNGLTASDEWRCRQCGYSGRLITRDWYKGGYASVRTYRGGFLRCPNPRCLTQGSFMKRRRFDQVARFYEWDPRYDQAEFEMQQALLRQFSTGPKETIQTPTTPNISIPA